MRKLKVFAFIILAVVLPSQSAKAMEEVVVTGVALTMNPIIIQHILDWLGAMNSPHQNNGDDGNGSGSGANQNQEDFVESHQNTDCGSNVETRAEWAAAMAGFRPAGSTFWVDYPGGGHQSWMLVSHGFAGTVVSEWSTCLN